jgi:hypothetical protein
VLDFRLVGVRTHQRRQAGVAVREDGEGLTRLPALIQQGRAKGSFRIVGTRTHQAKAAAGLTRGFDLAGDDLPMAVRTIGGGAHVRAVQGDRKVRTG